MMKKIDTPLTEVKKKILTEIAILKELKKIQDSLKKADGEERKKILGHVGSLKDYLKKTKNEIILALESLKMNIPLGKSTPILTQQQSIPLTQQKQELKKPIAVIQKKEEKTGEEAEEIEEKFLLEKETVKRLRKKEEKILEKKAKKPSWYVKTASKIFANYSRKLINQGYFRNLERDLIKANMEFVLASYVSVMFFTTLLSVGAAILIFAFFLFFNLGSELPIITLAKENIGIRFLKTFWILFVVPTATLLAMYFYPSLEKKSIEARINQELPFVTIHLAAISGSLIEPSNMFRIIISTEEYPHISKEFTKLLNQINVYGYDLVGALRNTAFNSASRKLADLFNGLATAITSGGNLSDFFDKRANTLLFEHKLEREKQAKTAETFMDIYISVVIAAPMILMLLLMMLKIGGLGVGISTGTITIIMILGVVMINIFFLMFLHLKQPSE